MEFDTKTQIKLLKKIDKLFNVSNNTIDLTQQENKIIMSENRVYAIQPKTIQAKKFLNKYADVESITENIFEYEPEPDKTQEARVKVKSELLKKVIDFMSVFEESVIIKAKNDYPLWVENEHFIMIIAPMNEY